MTSDEEQAGSKAVSAAYQRKQNRKRPDFLNQETLDRIAREHSQDLKELGAKDKDR